MDRKKVILLVSALLIAVLSAFMARSMLTGASAPNAKAVVAAPVPTGPKVLVATRALPVGTLITAEALRYQPWPEELVEEAYFIEGGEGQPDIEKLAGTVVRTPITAGQPVTQGSLVAPGDRGFLAAALSPGMRAIAIPMKISEGVAGFVFPGDRVDLFLTQGVPVQEGQPLKVSETIVRNVRVLATDQRAQPTVDENGNTQVRSFTLVTVEMTPRMAEKITVARSIGTISMSLRALADNATELEQALASGSVKIPAGATPEEEQRILASVKSRPIDGGGTFSTGGDISRFQRREAPKTVIQAAAQAAVEQKTIEKIVKGPVVRVSRGANTQEVQIERR
ncbi:Flp pilus assembly protein CpaB [Sphingorhabdus arenilitoris]|uniref:Flp pilus assembly protein CpaB n=1 Tax=Sphingorhabdus arenilitoris TaxID=1490041 RepID=A0ABV8RHI3_9SPHN